jgi:DNA-3-methyladenine glycosylase
MQPLPRAFYDRETVTVARELLGKYLVRGTGRERQVGRIVEVEAYLGPHDRAAHSARGRTARNAVMFGPPGRAYVYLIYGIHYCFNVVTEGEGHAAAVLIRALEPIKNLRGKTNGPGLLCRAMQIDQRLNGYDLVSNDFLIAEPPTREEIAIVKRPRIGVEYAGYWARRHLRFYIANNVYISRK